VKLSTQQPEAAMAKDPTVTVIIPTYNRAHFIGRAISSVLSQTYSDFELIVVDDGSTDNTAKVVGGFKDHRIVYFKHKSNLGISAARNTALRVSRGQYIAFLDDDDEWLPNKLSDQLDALAKAPSGVGAVYTQLRRVQKDRVKLGYRETPPEGYIHGQVLSRPVIYLSTLMLKRDHLEKTGVFDEGFALAEDWDFLIRLSKHCRFRYIKTPLVIRYLTIENISLNNPIMPREIGKILTKHSGEIRGDRRILAAHRRRLAHRYAGLGDDCCSKHNMAAGRRYYVRAMRAYPFDLELVLGFVSAMLGHTFYKVARKVHASIKRLTGR
jgi:glycosyltransferase involved in cell wall biosynthesis